MANDRYSLVLVLVLVQVLVLLRTYLLILAFSLYRTVSASEIARTGRRNHENPRRLSVGPVMVQYSVQEAVQ